jgi:hypothetical protein
MQKSHRCRTSHAPTTPFQAAAATLDHMEDADRRPVSPAHVSSASPTALTSNRIARSAETAWRPIAGNPTGLPGASHPTPPPFRRRYQLTPYGLPAAARLVPPYPHPSETRRLPPAHHLLAAPQLWAPGCSHAKRLIPSRTQRLYKLAIRTRRLALCWRRLSQAAPRTQDALISSPSAAMFTSEYISAPDGALADQTVWQTLSALYATRSRYHCTVRRSSRAHCESQPDRGALGRN